MNRYINHAHTAIYKALKEGRLMTTRARKALEALKEAKTNKKLIKIDYV